MNRREFCTHACQAVSLVTVGAAFQGCGGDSPTSPSDGSGGAANLPAVSGTVSGRSIAVTVDSGPLATVGGAALVQSTAGNFLVTRISQDAFSALTAVCTHEGCTITGITGNTFVCPCHGSQFSSGGAVVRSPATRALTTYATAFSANTLTITT